MCLLIVVIGCVVMASAWCIFTMSKRLDGLEEKRGRFGNTSGGGHQPRYKTSTNPPRPPTSGSNAVKTYKTKVCDKQCPCCKHNRME